MSSHSMLFFLKVYQVMVKFNMGSSKNRHNSIEVKTMLTALAKICKHKHLQLYCDCCLVDRDYKIVIYNPTFIYFFTMCKFEIFLVLQYQLPPIVLKVLIRTVISILFLNSMGMCSRLLYLISYSVIQGNWTSLCVISFLN